METNTDFYKLIPYINLLYIEAFSDWDERVTIQLLKDITSIAQKLYKETPWGILADNRKWGLHTPDSENSMRSVKLSTPLTHHAVVVGESQIKRWQISNIFGEMKGFETKIFSEMQEAKEWLGYYGYKMEQLVQTEKK